jgi:hypothetical protein
LNGTYVFQAGGVDAVGPVYAAGTLAFDGNGNITSGVLDANSASGTVVANMSSISGTYSVTADGRGLMTLTGTGIETSVPFALAISKDGSKGKFIEFDGKAAVAGTFEKQTAGALSGTYTFRLSGFEVSSAAANCAGKPACYMGEVGVLTVPSSGTALAGFADANLTNGNSYPTGAFGGTFNAPTSGRGTMTVNLRNGTPVSLVYYVVSPNKFFMASANTETSEIFAGQAESQGTLAAFSGDYTFLLDHAATPTTGTFEKTGRMSLASGAITQGSEAEDLSSSAVQDQSFDFSGGTYTDPTAGPQGQGTISGIVTSTGVPLNRYFVYYAVDSTKAYMLQTTANCTQAGVNTCDGGAFRAAIGEFEGGGSTLLPVSGDFIFSSNELGELVLGNCSPCGQNLQVGQLVSDGSGGFSGIVDAVKHAGAGTSAIISSIPVSSTMLGSVPTALCATSTCTFEHGWTPSNFQALAITNYLVYVRSDGNKAVLLGYQPDIDGVMDLQ